MFIFYRFWFGASKFEIINASSEVGINIYKKVKIYFKTIEHLIKYNKSKHLNGNSKKFFLGFYLTFFVYYDFF